jgi:hypothetical protein
MSHILLRFVCAKRDVEIVFDALRATTEAPVHVRDEPVRGMDFGDAGTGEQVAGSLRRVTLEVQVEATDISSLAEAVEGARRKFPVRWHAVPLVATGRIA